MSTPIDALTPEQTERLTRRGLRLAQFTIADNVAEGVVAVTAGLVAGLVRAGKRALLKIAIRRPQPAARGI